jgi:hypothetical protein
LVYGCSQITKAVDTSLVPAPAGSVLPYMLQFKGEMPYLYRNKDVHQPYSTDKHVLNEDEKKTQESVILRGHQAATTLMNRF